MFTSINDTYIDNVAQRFGFSIFLQKNSTLYLSNGYFKNKDNLIWGEIDLTDTYFTITDSVFEDIKSNYNPVLHAEESSGIIQNSNFINLYANLSAGAMSFIDIRGEISAINCTFTNITSNKNAGALLFISEVPDGLSDNYIGDVYGRFNIADSQFINCSSEFGGAIMQLEGLLSVKNTNFTDNIALYGGAGIYTSFVNSTLDNVNFNDNIVIYPGPGYDSGGAIYTDIGYFIVDNCNFTDNYASNASAIYLYDSNYTIRNSYFEGENTNYIYSVFDGETAVIDDSNTMINPDNSLNLTDYVTYIERWGKEIDYNPVILDEALVNESYFNLVDYGLVTPVRYQGWSGSCWAFGSVSVLESAFLKATNRTLELDISENYIKNTALKYFSQGVFANEASDQVVAASKFLSWIGIVESSLDEFDELGRVSAVIDYNDSYHIYDFFALPDYDISLIDDYKMFLIKYGALATSVHGADGGGYNETTYGSCFKRDGWNIMADHVVTVVGWNDSYSRNNFNVNVTGDGARIIKNSWGTDWGDNGYYYVSYYDELFASVNPFGAVGYIVNNEHNYEKVYQYDICSTYLSKSEKK